MNVQKRKQVTNVVLFLLLFIISDSLIANISKRSFSVAMSKFSIFDLFIHFSLDYSTLLYATLITAMLFFVVLEKQTNKKKYRPGQEYGTARFGTEKDAAIFRDPDKFQNIILSETEELTMSPYAIKGQDPSTSRNKNVLVVGGSGSGKTRFFIKPNLLQMHSDYVVTDPKGSLIVECGKALKHGYHDKNGERIRYDVRSFNLIDLKQSMKYNPFAYIQNESELETFITTLISNTTAEGEKQDFWVKAESLLYSAYIGYLFAIHDKKDVTFDKLLELLLRSEVSEQNEDAKSSVDYQFDDLEELLYSHQNDRSFLLQCFTEQQLKFAEYAVRSYKSFKVAAGKTLKSILISCNARLKPFSNSDVLELTSVDELHLDDLGDYHVKQNDKKVKRNIALFVVISDTDTTLNFLVSIMYTQLFQMLCKKADVKYANQKSKLPHHVRFLLDEFANIGQIPRFEKLIATIRSREISASIVLQTQSQLKALYKDNASTIIGNCDSFVFLGGKEKETLKDLSEILGKETIDTRTFGRSRGQSGSFSENYQQTGKDLMGMDQLSTMSGKKCIVQIRGAYPFFSNKYKLENHPRYKRLSDFDEKNIFIFSPKRTQHTKHLTDTSTELKVSEIDASSLKN